MFEALVHGSNVMRQPLKNKQVILWNPSALTIERTPEKQNRRNRGSPSAAAKMRGRQGIGRLLQNGFVKFLPVIEVVEINSIPRSGSIVRDSVGRENAFAGGVVMNVAANRGVQAVNRVLP